jgi:hypothetical protein
MGYYQFRMSTDTHAFEADCFCRDDLAAKSTAERLSPDFNAVEVWDGTRRVVLVTKGNQEGRAPSGALDTIKPLPR